ncbi:hypothetical protein [Cryptosporangium aurantiacum]|nr:hypothetical protein [Cryptosporangium aurantiacum]
MTALVITSLGVVYTTFCAVTQRNLSFGWLAQTVLHIGELLVVVALAGTADRSLVVRAGLGAAAIGQGMLALAEVVWTVNPDLANVLFGVGPMATGIGMIVAGIGIARRWDRPAPHRFTPLALGIYVFAVLTPVLIGSGGPPAPAALWAIAGWDVLWALAAVGVLPPKSSVETDSPRVEAELR